MKFELRELIGFLDEKTKRLLEDSVQRCIKRGGNEILIEDILFCMTQEKDSFLNSLLEYNNIDNQKLIQVLQNGVAMQSTESSSPVFSTLLIQLIEDAYILSKISLNTKDVSNIAIIMAIFDNSIKYSQTKYFKIIETITLKQIQEFITKKDDITKKDTKKDKQKSEFSEELEKYTTNLTKLAKDNLIDPVLCRDMEIKQAIDILLRRRKNNPIMVGEAGVGKTAVVEGLALKIVNKEVPDCLYNAHILSLDLGVLQAGASVKGEFEKRLQLIIDEIQNSPLFIILFIDEAHTLIGAGGNEGSGDAANLLKPALARGKLKTIAATTWLEYRKYFEKDPALSRRFQKVDLLEPTTNNAITILRGLCKKYEEAHNVYIEDEAISAAANLSARYITSRQLPDKAIDVLDTACANVKISKTNIPFELQKIDTSIQELQREKDFYQRDSDNKIKDYSKKIALLSKDIKKLQEDAKKIKKDWEIQKTEIFKLEKLIEDKNSKEIEKQTKKIKKLQEKNNYINLNVTKEQIAQVISSWTGIPLGNIVKEKIENIMNLDNIMKKTIIGQDNAISYLSQFLKISTAGLKKENSPLGVFLLVGPSGVGKTQTALSIADIIFGGERFITTINMTEFQEKHTVSRLIGSPPGYVGYGDGGQLTDPVRVKPYSVVLLDEIEKAHPDILNIFYQLFDKGVLNDGEGKEIDFRNTIIIMTSNLATQEIGELCQKNKKISLEELTTSINPILTEYLKPALLGRMNIIPYSNLKDEDIKEITKLKLEVISKQLNKKEINFNFDDKVLNYILSLANTFETGARNIELIINTKIMPKLSQRILELTINKKNIKDIKLSINSKSELDIKCS